MKKFKVGDMVRCLPTPKDNPDGFPNKGGHGYEPNLEFVVSEVNHYSNYQIAFGGKCGAGVYSNSLELVTEENKMEKQTITRDQLKEIWAVACATWRKTLETYANRDVFSNTIGFTNDEVTDMFKASSIRQKEVLESVGLKLTVESKFVDLSSLKDKIGTTNNSANAIWLGENIAKKQGLTHKCIGLSENYAWELGTSDSGNIQILIPKRK